MFLKINIAALRKDTGNEASEGIETFLTLSVPIVYLGGKKNQARKYECLIAEIFCATAGRQLYAIPREANGRYVQWLDISMLLESFLCYL